MTIGVEGVYSNDQNDKGNWTGGEIGKGQLKGTKYGVSAASYPNHDIKNLTLQQAKEIYLEDYWNALKCDTYDAKLAVLLFDSGVNNGVGAANKFLAEAIKQKSVLEQCMEFQAQRLKYMGSLSTWNLYGLGWSRRLIKVLATAMQI